MTVSTGAAPSLVFPSKTVEETIQLRFPFLSLAKWGETFTSVSFTARVESGIDSNPSTILHSTSPDPIKTTMLLQVTGGLVGVIYIITCTVIGTSGNTYQLAGRLAIVPGEV